MTPKYKNVLLKLSGEALQGEQGFGIDANTLQFIAHEIRSIHDLNINITIVIGGGNIFRGLKGKSHGVERVTGDYMGMLATIINSMALQSALESVGISTRVQTAIEMQKIAEPFIRRRALRHLEKGRIVIFGGGTGNPYFTTDTTAALRSSEMGSEILIKATKVNGIYDKDPLKHNDAVKYNTITYMEAISQNLGVMDMTAVSLCMENKVPILVLNMLEKDNIKRAVLGEKIGTLVHS